VRRTGTISAGRLAALGVLTAGSFALMAPVVGASTQSVAWLTSQAQPTTTRLQLDQQAISAIHGHWAAKLNACKGLVRDSQAARKSPPAPTQGLRSAWKALVVADLQYAQACVSWAHSKGTRDGGSVQVLGQQLATAQTAWMAAASAAQSPNAPPPGVAPTTTTTAPVQTQVQFEASCSFLMPFTQLVTESTTTDSSCVTEQGIVYQYDNNTGASDMLVELDDNTADLIDVQLSDPSIANGVNTNDTIQVWGPISGSDTYSDQSGNNVTVPVVTAMYLTLVSAPAAGG